MKITCLVKQVPAIGAIVNVGTSLPDAADVSVAGEWRELVPRLLDAVLEKR